MRLILSHEVTYGHGLFGPPQVMYSFAELCDTEDFMCPVSVDEIRVCNEAVTFREEYPCDAGFFKFVAF